MANNSDLGCDGPSPDFVPDENTETVDETVDLNPMVFLSKLQKVQEHFGRQMLDVQFMLGRMETRAIRAETALADSEKTLVGKMTEVEKIAEKAAKKNPTLVGIKRSVTIATGPEKVNIPTNLPSRNNIVDDERSLTKKVGNKKSVTIATGQSKVYIPTHLPSRNNSDNGTERNLTVVGNKKSVTIAVGPDEVFIPTLSTSRNNSVDGNKVSTPTLSASWNANIGDRRKSALHTTESVNRPSGLSVSNWTATPTGNNTLSVSGASLQLCSESCIPTVQIQSGKGRRSNCFIGSRVSEAEESF